MKKQPYPTNLLLDMYLWLTTPLYMLSVFLPQGSVVDNTSICQIQKATSIFVIKIEPFSKFTPWQIQ